MFGEDLNLHALGHRRQAMDILLGVSKKIDKLRKAAEKLHGRLYNNLGYYELESLVEYVGGSNKSFKRIFHEKTKDKLLQRHCLMAFFEFNCVAKSP